MNVVTQIMLNYHCSWLMCNVYLFIRLCFFQVYVHVDEEKKRKKVQNNYFEKIAIKSNTHKWFINNLLELHF